jgi:hypothetical protein
MKTTKFYTMLVLLLTAGGVTVQAQEYLPIAQKGNEWHAFGTSIHWIDNYVNWCPGDTLIEGVQYMKIMGTINNGSTILNSVLREENGKVWMRHLSTSEEKLLYDFTASVGDTLCLGDWDACFVLDSISTEQIGGIDRRKFWFGLEYDNMGRPRAKETWVEGIGSDFGLLWSGYYGIPDGWHCLLCFHQYGELVWAEYGFCTYDVVEETKDSEISIYPNPAKDRVVIEGLEAAEVQVFNAFGQLVKAVQGTNEVAMASLPQGIYLLRIADTEGKVLTAKVAVNK